jgi:hypothetical protein
MVNKQHSTVTFCLTLFPVLCLIAFSISLNLCAGAEHLPLSVSYARILEKIDICNGVELDESFNEVPPGLESSFVPLPHIDKNTYQPSKSMNSIPMISRFTTSGLCRQRLHANGVKECRSLFSDTISKCLDSWYRRQNVLSKSAAGP